MVRPKFRYIVIHIACVKKLPEMQPLVIKHNDLYKALILMIKKIHGDYGLATIKTGFTCKYCNEITQVAIVKVRHGPHRFVSTVIPLITQVAGTAVRLETIHTTATLHQAYLFLKRYQQLELERLTNKYLVKDKIEGSDGWLQLQCKCTDLQLVEDLLIKERN